MSKKGSLSSWESLYNTTSNKQIRDLILKKAKAGASFPKFKSAFDAWSKATSPKWKDIYKKRMRHA